MSLCPHVAVRECALGSMWLGWTMVSLLSSSLLYWKCADPDMRSTCALLSFCNLDLSLNACVRVAPRHASTLRMQSEEEEAARAETVMLFEEEVRVAVRVACQRASPLGLYRGPVCMSTLSLTYSAFFGILEAGGGSECVSLSTQPCLCACRIRRARNASRRRCSSPVHQRANSRHSR